MAALLALGPNPAFAKSTPLELRWSELASMIVGQHVQLAIPDGTWIRGEAIAVREDSLLIDVKQASGETHYEKGNASIPRSSITLIQLERMRGSWGRSMGTVIGVLTGLATGGYVAGSFFDTAGSALPVFVAIAAGITLAGHFSGRAMDRRSTMIRVLP